MATYEEALLTLIKEKRTEGKWDKAMKDILYFIEYYVPKNLFDLRKAAPQQKEMFEAVQTGDSYYIIRAPRKGGKTVCVAIIAVWLTLRDQTYRVFILSGSQEQAGWLYDYCSKILRPRDNPALTDFYSQFLVDGDITKRRVSYLMGGYIMYAPASEKQVNAPTADCLIMDEYVLIPSNIVEEAWPMIRQSTNPRRFLLSTATAGKDNTESFLDLLEEAKRYGFKKFEWAPEDCPFLMTATAKKDSEIAKMILSAEMFNTQYKGGMPKRAGRVFARTQIREAIIAPDPEHPGFLLDGTPFELDPSERISRGESKGGIDWGFDHDTVLIIGYRELGGRLILTRMIVDNGTSASEYGDLLLGTDEPGSPLGLALQFNANDWYADASGAFQNQELKNRGLRVVSRAFQHQTRGKEWMIGICEWYLRYRKLVIPDIPEFDLLKEQIKRWRRDTNGKPKKGFDHCNDALIAFTSGFHPSYYETIEDKITTRVAGPPLFETDWDSFNSEKNQWMPQEWQNRKEELTRNPWER